MTSIVDYQESVGAVLFINENGDMVDNLDLGEMF